MTAAATARNSRVPCPEPGCTYTMNYAGSIPAHVAMAHPEVPMDAVAPRRRLAGAPAAPDSDDQHWLDDRIAAIEDGIEAVLDIAREWTEGRNLSRLHPGTSAQDYILARVKHPLGRGVVLPLLAESDWSNRQIATVAGVDEGTVRNVQRTAEYSAVDRPAETLGADGKYRPGRVVRTVVAEVIDTPSAEEVASPAAELKAAAAAMAPAMHRHRPSVRERRVVQAAHDPMCRMTSKSTGQGCQQPERWLMAPPPPPPMEVCQQHGKMLERQGWRFVRELHPVPGFDRDGRLPAEAGR